jgi:hypothetical protein
MHLGFTPWRCSTNSLGKPSPPLYSTMRRGRCQLHGTVPPTFVRLTRRALERGRQNPRKRTNTFSMSTQDYAVTSDRRERSSPSLSSPVRPSPPLRRRCNATPSTAATSPTLLRRTGTGHRHDRYCASYGPPSTPSSRRPAGGGRTSNFYATTLEATPVRAQDSPRHPNRSKIRRDGRQLHGTARHAFTRRRIVRHTCKLLSAWPIKGGVLPPPQGGHGDGRRLLARFLPSPDIGTCLNQYLWDLEDQPPLPPRL